MDEALEIAAWRLSIGELPGEQIVSLATEALARGVDSPSLRESARLPPAAVRDAADLFRAALDEVGIQVPSVDEAMWNLIRLTARQIVAGEVPAIDGAKWIWVEASHRVQEEGDLRAFIGLASEWDDHPPARAELAEQIVEESQALLERRAPRRWRMLHATRGGSPLTFFRPSGHMSGHVDVDLASLPLSARVIQDLERWAEDYDRTRDGFNSAAEAREFVERGRDLASRLQDELGAAWCIEYRQEPTQLPGLRLREGR